MAQPDAADRKDAAPAVEEEIDEYGRRRKKGTTKEKKDAGGDKQADAKQAKADRQKAALERLYSKKAVRSRSRSRDGQASVPPVANGLPPLVAGQVPLGVRPGVPGVLGQVLPGVRPGPAGVRPIGQVMIGPVAGSAPAAGPRGILLMGGAQQGAARPWQWAGAAGQGQVPAGVGLAGQPMGAVGAPRGVPAKGGSVPHGQASLQQGPGGPLAQKGLSGSAQQGRPSLAQQSWGGPSQQDWATQQAWAGSAQQGWVGGAQQGWGPMVQQDWGGHSQDWGAAGWTMGAAWQGPSQWGDGAYY